MWFNAGDVELESGSVRSLPTIATVASWCVRCPGARCIWELFTFMVRQSHQQRVQDVNILDWHNGWTPGQFSGLVLEHCSWLRIFASNLGLGRVLSF